MKVLERQQVLDALPTNWLDNLLTGPEKVIRSGDVYSAEDIEKVLLAVRQRVLALPSLESCDVCNGLVDSTADACRHCG